MDVSFVKCNFILFLKIKDQLLRSYDVVFKNNEI
jgi:hypothetical protein